MSQSDDQLSASQLRAKVRMFCPFLGFPIWSHNRLPQHAVGGNQNPYSGIVSRKLVCYNVPIVDRVFFLSNCCFRFVQYD